jgi:ParB family chromosome partitioning protein
MNVEKNLGGKLNMQTLKIADLIPHSKNDDFFDDIEGQKWTEFLESVKTSGIIEPIVVTNGKVIVSGHQRVRACKELGIDEINCDVRIYEDDDKILKDLIETNIRQRGNINSSSLKTGRIIVELERIYGIYNGNHRVKDSQIGKAKTQKDIAEMLDTPTSEYFRLKALTTMIPELQTIVTEKKVSPSVASAVLTKLSEEDQHTFANMVKDTPLGVKITQKVAEQYVDQIQERDRQIQDKDKEIELLEKEAVEWEEKLNRHTEEPDDMIDEIDRLKAEKREQYERAERIRKELDTAKRENESRKKAFEQQGKRVDEQAEMIERLEKQLQEKDAEPELGKHELPPSLISFNVNMESDPEDTLYSAFIEGISQIEKFLNDCEDHDIVGDVVATGRSTTYIEKLSKLKDRVAYLIEQVKPKKIA